ncbi:MAG: porin [Armatimonadetes bacterium]|nr:porin [Armatimonadota bacterium]
MRLRHFSRICLPLLLVVGGATNVQGAPEVMPFSGIPETRIELRGPIVAPLLGGNLLVPRWESTDVSGSAARFGKYAVPLEGGTIGYLQVDSLQGDQSLLRLSLSNPGEAATAGGVRYDVPFPRAFIALAGDRFRFNLYPEAGGSIRQNWLASAGTVLADGKTFVGVDARHTGLRITKTTRNVDWSANTTRVLASRPFGSGDLTFGLDLRDFVNRDGVGVGSHLTGYRLNYATVLPRLSTLGLTYARAETALLGRSPAVDAITLLATSPVGGKVIATARLDNRRVSRPIAQTAFTRAATAARFDVRYSGIRGLKLRAGYDRTESDRVNRSHTSTDHPVWDKLWATATYRPVRRWQVLGKAFARANDNPPPSGLSDPALGAVQSTILPLVMNLDRGAELRLQGAPSDNSSVYLAAATRYRKNTRRVVEVQYDTTSLGGWLQVGPRASLNADYTIVWADSRNLPVAQWLSDSKVATVGGSFTVSSRLSLDGSYANYRATGSQSITQDTWGISARRQLTPGSTWSLDFRRDQYRDRVSTAQSYTANVLGVSGSTRF